MNGRDLKVPLVQLPPLRAEKVSGLLNIIQLIALCQSGDGKRCTLEHNQLLMTKLKSKHRDSGKNTLHNVNCVRIVTHYTNSSSENRSKTCLSELIVP